MASYIPANNSSILGTALMKYVGNEISRDDLMSEIIDFWKEN